jgi:hypothetical protein
VQGQSPYDYFPGTYETDLARYPSGEMISLWMKEAGFVGCERRIAARIEHDFIYAAAREETFRTQAGGVRDGPGKACGVALIDSIKRGAQTCRFTITWL